MLGGTSLARGLVNAVPHGVLMPFWSPISLPGRPGNPSNAVQEGRGASRLVLCGSPLW